MNADDAEKIREIKRKMAAEAAAKRSAERVREIKVARGSGPRQREPVRWGDAVKQLVSISLFAWLVLDFGALSLICALLWMAVIGVKKPDRQVVSRVVVTTERGKDDRPAPSDFLPFEGGNLVDRWDDLQGKVIQFAYEDAYGGKTMRRVEVKDSGPMYLRGFCFLRNDMRTFVPARVIGAVFVEDTGELLRLNARG